jgi:hypothetical protein
MCAAASSAPVPYFFNVENELLLIGFSQGIRDRLTNHFLYERFSQFGFRENETEDKISTHGGNRT